ncbi:MAG: polysaccharide biosynthesis tyrosine autokinase [Elusimicrobiales bacterium]|nr:polysaccharide biosynthesis tyrosine autokinase [Elusimicrobiales bacterium]
MEAELTLYDYWRIVNRRKWVALLVFAVTVFSALFYTRLQPTVYRSQALIKIKPPASYSKMPGSDMMDFDPWSAVATELKVITSSEISERAAARLGLPSGAKSTAEIARSYKVERLQESNLISLSAFSGDPARAADIAAAVIEAYRDFDLEQKSLQARKTLEDISGRKNEVEDNLRALERQKQSFVERNPKTGLGAAMANQLADLEIRKKQLLEKYTPNHPDVLSVDQRIEVIEARLGEIPAQEVALARISRELRMQEELYTTLNKQHEEAKLGVSSMVSFVSVVNRPMPESVPISPNRPLNMLAGSVLGLFLAVVVVFLLENLDVSISTIEDIENFLKLPVLGIIPNILSEKHIDNWLTQVFKKERYTVDAFRSVLVVNKRYASGVIESYHTLRTNIMSNLNTKASISLVISSAGAAEGKTLTAVNFALASAHSGLKTLLIDADLRRPAINQIFGTRKDPGLSDVLAGRADWRDAVLESADFIMGGLDFDQLMRFPGIENLKILNCGTQPDNVIDILDSANWTELMEELKGEFDLIIFDAPPVLLFADSLMIAKHASDGVVLVYKAGKIARGALKRAKEQIGGVNARMLGVVLNGVRASEMGPQYGYYYSDYKNYARR